MMHSHHRWHEDDRGWERVGRTAERFARRMAHDARRFAERVEENVAEFARDVKREIRSGDGNPPDTDVRRIFEGVRSVLRSVIDGVDELVAGFTAGNEPHARHHDRPDDGRGDAPGGRHEEASAGAWTRVVYNHDAACVACGGSTAAGTEGWVRQTPEGLVFRCVACGPAAA
jgi:hypothetical protein